MARMTYPTIQLSRLRTIGWTHWDPIGLADKTGVSLDECADEYDSYLLHVVEIICDRKSLDEAASYLTWVASEQMGLPKQDGEAAMMTARAIAGYLISLPDGPKTIGV